ncbi:RNase H family protein, partial [Aphelenchoides avenae]
MVTDATSGRRARLMRQDGVDWVLIDTSEGILEVKITIRPKVSMVLPLRYPFASVHDAPKYLMPNTKENTIEVYTDGACTANFRFSGGGIVYGLEPWDKLNASFSFDAPHCSKRAEILAITFALWQLLRMGTSACHIILKTDFLPVVLFFKKWATADGIGYPDELNELNALAQCFTGGVEIVHVKGDGTDPLNREADKLAKRATQPERGHIHNSKPWRVDMKSAFDLLQVPVPAMLSAEESQADTMNREASGPSNTQDLSTSNGAVDVDNHDAWCIGMNTQKWTVSDALAATIVFLTDKYQDHAISSLDNANCEVGIGYDGPFTYFEGELEFNNKQPKPDGTRRPTASTTRIAYAYHGKEAIARVLSVNGDDLELTNDVFMVVRKHLIVPFDNAIVSGGGHLTEQVLPRDGSLPVLENFIGWMKPYLEANPADSEQASIERFTQACYRADHFLALLFCEIVHRNMPEPQDT